jgi:hypothetical protein
MPKMPKNAIIFNCEKCNFKCSKKSNYVAHLATLKHKNWTFLNEFEQKNAERYFCKWCDKTYNGRSGLWYHEKICMSRNVQNVNPLQETNPLNETNIILTLLHQNNQLQNKILEICREQHNVTNINNINSHNKTFNLNVFLNETCKDAMNITEFVDSLKLQLSDLENVGRLGYVEGISNIIVQNLNSLDETKRPIHCTDKKREVLYVKDEDRWGKENNENKKIRKAIQTIANKNTRLLPEYKTKHVNINNKNDISNDQYNKLLIEVMGGPGDNDKEKENKIIKKIVKNVMIDKC